MRGSLLYSWTLPGASGDLLWREDFKTYQTSGQIWWALGCPITIPMNLHPLELLAVISPSDLASSCFSISCKIS